MSEPLVIREDHGPVALLVLNRPERRNALSRALVSAFEDALGEVAVSTKVRSVVVTGAGVTFCSGMDMNEAAQKTLDDASQKRVIADTSGLADLVNQLHTMGKPTIAALNGDALAGGAGVALACDFVIASEGARIGYPEVKRGLVASVVLTDLLRQVGERRARELLLTGESIDAEQALRWGMVNRVVPASECRAEALKLALDLTDRGPQALATTKRLIDDSSGRPSDLRGAAAITAAVLVSDEALEGMAAFLEKRPPAWARSPS